MLIAGKSANQLRLGRMQWSKGNCVSGRKSLTRGRRSNDNPSTGGVQRAAQANDGACQQIVLGLWRRGRREADTTVRELHQLTDLPLNQAFAALRKLEYDKIIDIVDDLADPFGARIVLRSTDLDYALQRSAI